jgi:6-pyruvoyltetrahydropterin/6-carboxytetrahydropterin synthase
MNCKDIKKMITVTKEYNFSAGHFLPGHEICGFVHGHNYKLFVTVGSSVVPMEGGMVIDFHELDGVVKMAVLNDLDHPKGLLNAIIPYGAPTVENIARFCFEQIKALLNTPERYLKSVRLYETDKAYCDYEQ